MSGREFTESDRASTEPVVMMNETLAHTLWPGQDAVGQIVTQDGGRRVIGVVGDVHHGGPERLSGSEMYLPMRQTADYPAMKLVVRTALPRVGGQRGVAAEISGFASIWICWVRAFAGIARNLRFDFFFGESTHKRDRYTYDVGSKLWSRTASGPHEDFGISARRGGTGYARLFRLQ